MTDVQNLESHWRRHIFEGIDACIIFQKEAIQKMAVLIFEFIKYLILSSWKRPQKNDERTLSRLKVVWVARVCMSFKRIRKHHVEGSMQ